MLPNRQRHPPPPHLARVRLHRPSASRTNHAVQRTDAKLWRNQSWVTVGSVRSDSVASIACWRATTAPGWKMLGKRIKIVTPPSWNMSELLCCEDYEHELGNQFRVWFVVHKQSGWSFWYCDGVEGCLLRSSPQVISDGLWLVGMDYSMTACFSRFIAVLTSRGC